MERVGGTGVVTLPVTLSFNPLPCPSCLTSCWHVQVDPLSSWLVAKSWRWSHFGLFVFFIRSNSNPMSVVVAVKGNKCLCYRPDSNRKENTGTQTILLCREEPTRSCSSFVSFVWFFLQKYISRIPHLSSTLVNFPFFFSFLLLVVLSCKNRKEGNKFFCGKGVRPPASHHLTDHKYRPKPIEFCSRKFGMFHLSFRGVTSPTPPPPPLSSSYTRSYTFLHFVIHIYSFISFSISYLFIYSLASATSFWTST